MDNSQEKALLCFVAVKFLPYFSMYTVDHSLVNDSLSRDLQLSLELLNEIGFALGSPRHLKHFTEAH